MSRDIPCCGSGFAAENGCGKEFDKTNGFVPPEPPKFRDTKRKIAKSCKNKFLTRKGLLSILYTHLPVTKWLPNYKRENLVPDVAAGITLAIYNVPQSMAYSVLATLPPVYGLYAAFFPPLFYFLLGSSNHVSIGVTDLSPIDVVVLLGFLTGVIQLLMWLLHLSFLSTYLSDSAVSGLTFGAALHAFIAQFSGLLGIKPRRPQGGFLKIVWLIVITIISAVLHLHEEFSVKVVGEIPLGLPAPQLPRFEWVLIRDLLVPAASIAVVAYAVTVSMGKLFARKHKYQIDTDQEMLAVGLAGSISSFFSVFPTSTSLSRTLVNEGAGARTQISGFVASWVILGVILVLAPLLGDLPMCVLNSIVVVALWSLISKVTEVRDLWRFSKTDVIVYVVTAIITICWDIIQGLVCGMVVAMFLVVVQTQRPSISLLGEVGGRNEYRAANSYSRAKRTPVPVIRFDSPVIFTNIDQLKTCVRKVVKNELGNSKDKGEDEHAMEPHPKAVILDSRAWSYTDAMGQTVSLREEMSPSDTVESACSTLIPPDSHGKYKLNEELRSDHILLILANLKSSIRLQYAHAGLYQIFREDQFCPTINDALSVAQRLNSAVFIRVDKDENVVVL
ncbi:unnamed protein product [Nippostrongylus brasiliensis]|uniref:Anion transporter SULP-2 (inferred by orthology to a C. elegans protein) n=1 Tax=Nippostrongylus brasiliensis TaxID=27835 RepID=A0A158R015_NIPBR|nr:unnamed protein product [Nippostrongylus brasiliensis]